MFIEIYTHKGYAYKMNCLLQNIQTNTFYLKIRQFIRFGIVGAINFGVSLGVYYLILILYSYFPSGYSSTNQIIFFFEIILQRHL